MACTPKFACMKTKRRSRIKPGTGATKKPDMKTPSILSSATLMPADMLTEEQLITQLRKEQPQAQALMVRRYRMLARKIASRYLVQPEDIEEAVQDTFVRAFRALPNFRGDCRLSTWIAKIAASVAINKVNSMRSRVRWENTLEDHAYHLSAVENSPSVEQRERHLWLSIALQQLNDKDAAVIERFYLREQSIEEIRQDTGWTVSDIKSRLCRARRRLRTVIEENFLEEVR